MLSVYVSVCGCFNGLMRSGEDLTQVEVKINTNKDFYATVYSHKCV